MKVCDFLEIGVSEELAGKCVEAVEKEFAGYVKAGEDGSSGVLELEKELSDLKEELARMETEKADEILQVRLEAAVDREILAVRGKNLKAIKALLDFDAMSIDNKGEVCGLKEQLDMLVLGENSKFLFEQRGKVGGGVRGAKIGEGSDDAEKIDVSKMTYTQLVAYLEQNPASYKNLIV